MSLSERLPVAITHHKEIKLGNDLCNFSKKLEERTVAASRIFDAFLRMYHLGPSFLFVCHYTYNFLYNSVRMFVKVKQKRRFVCLLNVP